MERLQAIMLWGFGLLAWMSVALSSFHTQDQQLGGKGGFEDTHTMIFLGYLTTALYCVLAWKFTKHIAFLLAGILIGVGGFWWVYKVDHPISGKIDLGVIGIAT